MTRWLWLLVLPFGSVAYAGIWLRRKWLAHEQAKVNDLIKKPVYSFTETDDSLRVNAERRRAAVEDKRRQANQIASGHIAERPRIVRPGIRE